MAKGTRPGLGLLLRTMVGSWWGLPLEAKEGLVYGVEGAGGEEGPSEMRKRDGCALVSRGVRARSSAPVM